MAAKDTAPDMTADRASRLRPTPGRRAGARPDPRRIPPPRPGHRAGAGGLDSIVGPALAAVTLPRRLSAGTLTIACAGPIAMELQHLSGELIARINSALGAQVVTALRFVQTALAAPVAVPPPPPSPQSAARAESAVECCPTGSCATALEALGRAVFGAAETRPSTRRIARR